MEGNNDLNNSSQIQSQSQQLEDEDRLSTPTDDNCPRLPEKIEGAQASLGFSLEANNDNSSSQNQSQQLVDGDRLRLSTPTDDNCPWLQIFEDAQASLGFSLRSNNHDNSSQNQSQQLEDEDRLSTLTDNNCPRPPERFKGAQASLDFSMEAKNDNNKSQSQSQGQQLEDQDRLSMLTDDILLSILGRLSSRMAARTGVLSTRWIHLPWLLPDISIDIKEFLSVACPDPIDAKHMEEAMVSLTKATRNFLVGHQRESTISSLHLKLYLINNLLCEVGQLVGDAIDSGLLKDLDLTVLHERDVFHCSDDERMQRGQEIYTFFSSYPSVAHGLTKLFLNNVGFDKLDMHHVLFDCCKQLKHLTLVNSDTGDNSLFKIDAPNSNLCVLEIYRCRFGRIEVVCLPKLEKFSWNTWLCVECVPLTFGFVPSLGELELSCGSSYDQREFKLSKLLHGVTGIHTLTLDFEGENLWLLPEIEELFTAFNKLRKLSIRGIFVEFDILWTMAFLVAAPFIEVLHIEVWEHPCDAGLDRLNRYLERRTPQWEMCFDGFENRCLKELEFVGFKSLEQQFTFIRSVLERSPKLQKIVLRGDEPCVCCDAREESPRPLKFPKKKDEQEMVVKRIKCDTFSPEIIFKELIISIRPQ